MQIAVTAKKMELTPAIRSYAEDKIGRLEKFLDGIMEANILLRVEKHRAIAEATLHAKHADFTGKEDHEDLYAAIDGLSDKLERQVRKYKTRNLSRRRVAKAGEEMLDVGTITILGALEPDTSADYPVVKEKFIHLDRLTPSQAISRMEVHGDEFWVFADAEAGLLSVAYRRKEGGYGVIRSAE
ncbi:MAG: ribosome-associated translation inhibitor RaiA [Candidatus Krumholzibacteriia bacterium]|nr:ribosome-associated translation inhibitor RaiA [bacterium]MCB9513234.1 ribosome-associated translation inhibitor RaiA [Candidatus Latescibacterota bacterium]MCB9514698.1 ribosome-associated translation inhibitor RaiA [Candidatus Latescibacterota bacterium]